MKIKFSAKRSDKQVTYSRSGEAISINGDKIDLSGDWVKLEPDVEGGQLEPSGNLLAGTRDKETGEITLNLCSPHSANAPDSERFPEPITLNDGDSVSFPRDDSNA